MGSSLSLSFISRLLFLLSCFLLIIITAYASSSSKYPLCHDDERSALLQFNQSFLIDEQASSDPSAYPKTESWKLKASSDCCSWDGVECNNNTGRVIGLHLNSSFLYGSINSSSSLFRLVHLQKLNLADNHFNYSHIPSRIGHLSRLTYLDLSASEFSGQIPTSIFQLQNLQALDVGFNQYLTGYFPEFNKSSPLEFLYVGFTSFFGELPDSIGNLNSLKELDIRGCNFSGSVPFSLGNLTQLVRLGLSDNNFNNFSLGNLAWLGKKTNLIELRLGSMNLNGDIPSFLGNLTQLELLYLEGNNLSGIVEFDMFLRLKNLVSLQLTDNSLSLLINSIINVTLPKYKFLGLAACNLSEFPDFLWHQDELEFLELSGNKIHGKIPKWIWNIGKETLWHFSVSDNFLTGFDQPPVVLSWTSLISLDLSSNMIQGSLPIPPPSTFHYWVSDNSLTGQISPLICNLTSLKILDLSNNNLSGILPQCWDNFTNSLEILNLRNNSLQGTIPQTCMNGSKLKMIDLNQNQLQGRVPRSLTNCKMLEILDLGNNLINDTFPSFLGTFLELRVLILRSNEFHGAITSPETKFEFPKLRIIDLSSNSFTGMLSSEYFENWNAMKTFHVEQLTYMEASVLVDITTYKVSNDYAYSMTITSKGTDRRYEKIPEVFTVIDFSSNKFEGDIPESFGNLKGLQLLNLSSNVLTGYIPSCLGNLEQLESLDLSQNKLSGEIPQQFTGLTFLAVLNVSHNQLIGLIPQGKQFGTFESSSFEGNSGLCGKPLSKKCENSKVSPSPPVISEQDNDFAFPSGYDWLFIVMGFGSGLVVGLIIGQIVTARKHEWFVETFGRKPQKRQRGNKRGHRIGS